MLVTNINVLIRSDTACNKHFITAARPLLLAHTTSCGDLEEGNLGLDSVGNDLHLLRVCHEREWGYVCSWRFNHDVSGEVVLQQLQCKTGGTCIKIVANNKLVTSTALHVFYYWPLQQKQVRSGSIVRDIE